MNAICSDMERLEHCLCVGELAAPAGDWRPHIAEMVERFRRAPPQSREERQGQTLHSGHPGDTIAPTASPQGTNPANLNQVWCKDGTRQLSLALCSRLTDQLAHWDRFFSPKFCFMNFKPHRGLWLVALQGAMDVFMRNVPARACILYKSWLPFHQWSL